MRRFAVIALLFVAVSPSVCRAQFGGGEMGGQGPPPSWKVKVTLADDKVVEGTIALKQIRLDCDLGAYDIKVEKIKEIRFAEPATPPNEIGFSDKFYGVAKVVTTSDEVLEGSFSLVPDARIAPKPLAITTNLGTLYPPAGKVRRISILGKAN